MLVRTDNVAPISLHHQKCLAQRPGPLGKAKEREHTPQTDSFLLEEAWRERELLSSLHEAMKLRSDETTTLKSRECRGKKTHHTRT